MESQIAKQTAQPIGGQGFSSGAVRVFGGGGEGEQWGRLNEVKVDGLPYTDLFVEKMVCRLYN